MSELLDFIETEARSNAAFHITNADSLQKESNTLLNLLLAGAGGALALATGLLQKTGPVPAWEVWGATAASIYLFILSGLVVWRCLWVQAIWPPANEPKNFPLTGFSVDDLREADLKNKQTCCDHNRARNEKIGNWLNKCRALSAATPLVIALAAVAAARVA